MSSFLFVEEYLEALRGTPVNKRFDQAPGYGKETRGIQDQHAVERLLCILLE
jgi:hypothetical protein